MNCVVNGLQQDQKGRYALVTELSVSYKYIIKLKSRKMDQINNIRLFIVINNIDTKMSNREVSCSKLISTHFVGVIVFIAFNYFVFVVEYLLGLRPAPYIVLLIIFHILFALLLWSMIKSIIGDPGRVPIYWGFFAQENENRRRRYCLLCHGFKPQRCHHCSTCQRCVLNMDHHCPWISNCVGFSNRKFFMLFLFYIIITLIFCICCEIPLLVMEYIRIFSKHQPLSVHTIIRSVGLIVQVSFFVVITMFFKFHVDLVLNNLQRQRNPNVGPNPYDISPYQNFVQVFGTNSVLWFFPIIPQSTQRGNGVVWQKSQ